MAYYKTQIKSLGAGYAIDVFGKRLNFVGNYPCQAGDTVWTDGSIIFGNLSNVSQPVLFDNASGVPILTNNIDLRGYFDRAGRFKKYDVAIDITDEQIFYNRWFLNNNNKIFYGSFPRTQTTEDIEVTDDNDVFFATTYSEFDYDSANTKDYFKIYGIDNNTSGYSLIKILDDFKGGANYVELMFLKLQKGGKDTDPVKWFAVIKTTHTTESAKKIPDTKRYEIIQHTDQTQEMSFTQPGIWDCTVEINEETIENGNVYYDDTHEEIFTIDSDNNKNVIYTSDLSVPCNSPYQSFYIQTQHVEGVKVDYTRYGMGPYPSPYNFEGTVTIEWTLETIMQSLDHYNGTQYNVVDDWVLVDYDSSEISETFNEFTYPVSDNFYILADDINSTLKLYDSDNSLVLDFATSDDEFLAGLTGFHNFAAVALTKNEYLLTLHQWNTKSYNFKYAYLWKIKDGKATLINNRCFNYRLRKMRNISKARR